MSLTKSISPLLTISKRLNLFQAQRCCLSYSLRNGLTGNLRGVSSSSSSSNLVQHAAKHCSPFYIISSSPLLTSRRSLQTINIGDDQESKEKKRKMERTVRWSMWGLLAFFGGSTIWALYEWGKPDLDKDGKPVNDEFSEKPLVLQYILRTIDKAKKEWQIYQDPSRDLLLPPPLEPPYIQPKYTLVIESNGTLFHPEWTYKTGWRFKKRPFVDYFLQQCGPPLFEIVIFTSDSGWTAAGMIESLDPRGNVMHWLFRDSTRYMNGVRVKDLNCLNRDLSRVIMIDWEKDACKLNPDNCLILKKYEGEDDDRVLFELAYFLRTIAIQDVGDVRSIINHYNQFENPLEVFKENQRLAMEQEEEKKQKAKSQSFVSTFKRK